MTYTPSSPFGNASTPCSELVYKTSMLKCNSVLGTSLPHRLWGSGLVVGTTSNPEDIFKLQEDKGHGHFLK